MQTSSDGKQGNNMSALFTVFFSKAPRSVRAKFSNWLYVTCQTNREQTSKKKKRRAKWRQWTTRHEQFSALSCQMQRVRYETSSPSNFKYHTNRNTGEVFNHCLCVCAPLPAETCVRVCVRVHGGAGAVLLLLHLILILLRLNLLLLPLLLLPLGILCEISAFSAAFFKFFSAMSIPTGFFARKCNFSSYNVPCTCVMLSYHTRILYNLFNIFPLLKKKTLKTLWIIWGTLSR